MLWCAACIWLPPQAAKRKLELVTSATGLVEGSVKEAEDHLAAKEYDLQHMHQQLEALKSEEEESRPGSGQG